jgi:hypothetical protein
MGRRRGGLRQPRRGWTDPNSHAAEKYRALGQEIMKQERDRS